MTVLILGGAALAVVAILWGIAEYAIRRMRRNDERQGRIAAWEQAELKRVGPEIFYGETDPR